MKQIIFIALLGSSLFSCSSTDQNVEKESLDIVRKYMHAVESNNISVMDSLLADDYKGFGPSINDSTTKKEALANWKYNSENLYKSIVYSEYQNISLHVGEGQMAKSGYWVSDWAKVTIHFKDGTGPVNTWVNAVYRINNGKIEYSRTFYNELDILEQLGYGLQ